MFWATIWYKHHGHWTRPWQYKSNNGARENLGENIMEIQCSTNTGACTGFNPMEGESGEGGGVNITYFFASVTPLPQIVFWHMVPLLQKIFSKIEGKKRKDWGEKGENRPNFRHFLAWWRGGGIKIWFLNTPLPLRYTHYIQITYTERPLYWWQGQSNTYFIMIYFFLFFHQCFVIHVSFLGLDRISGIFKIV